MRGGGGGGPGSGPSSGPSSLTPSNAALAAGRRGRMRAAPDINNEISFPSLGGPGPEQRSRGRYGLNNRILNLGGEQISDNKRPTFIMINLKGSEKVSRLKYVRSVFCPSMNYCHMSFNQ